MMLIGSAMSRRALLRQLWAMVQTRAEAASLVVSLQKTAVIQGVALYAVAALAASACITALIILIAVAVPPEYRAWALGLVSLVLAGGAVFAATKAGQLVKRDAALIAGFSKGLRLDLAMINLALKDPEAEDAKEIEKLERARAAVREAAAEKAGAPGMADDGKTAPTGPSASAATAAATAASPAAATHGSAPVANAPEFAAGEKTFPQDEAVARTAMHDAPGEGSAGGHVAASTGASPEAATEREIPEPLLVPAHSMAARITREHRSNGTA